MLEISVHHLPFPSLKMRLASVRFRLKFADRPTWEDSYEWLCSQEEQQEETSICIRQGWFFFSFKGRRRTVLDGFLERVVLIQSQTLAHLFLASVSPQDLLLVSESWECDFWSETERLQQSEWFKVTIQCVLKTGSPVHIEKITTLPAVHILIRPCKIPSYL